MASRHTDLLVAHDMHEKLNCMGVTENADYTDKENYRPRTLVDRTLELIDPTPNIHTLFVQFNARFFWNVLLPVEIKWSNRMTSCAGVCTFHKRNKQCVISLSTPLLKLRPRKDLVETLLHEMIHGYLFLTNNDRDRDGHGPNFRKHMHRINQEAGTNITIYHNFHDEVRLYQQHWWKCNGPCQHRPPYFGTVRRAINRAPGPSDYWWDEHEQNCNGQFIKIKEPENFKSQSKQNDKSKLILKDKKLDKSIADWFTKSAQTKSAYTPKVFTHTNSKTFTQTNKLTSSKGNGDCTILSQSKNEGSNRDSPLGIQKLGNANNNVHGWGVNGSGRKIDNTRNVSKNPKFAYSGTLGGTNNGQSNLLEKYLHINDNKNHRNTSVKVDSLLKSPDIAQKRPADKSLSDLKQLKRDFISCPICNVSISLEDINEHVDACLISDDKEKRKINNDNKHNDSKHKTKTSLTDKFDNNSGNFISIIHELPLEKSDTVPNKRLKLNDSNGEKYVSCPVCDKLLPSADVNQHLDECLLETDIGCKTSVLFNPPASNNNVINISSSSASSDLDDSVVIESPKTRSCVDKNDRINLEQKCLVCNVQITMSLNEHLEECIGAVFNDDTMTIDDEDSNHVFVKENNSIDSKYPCPVCMQIISESFMNQHLDTCLKNN